MVTEESIRGFFASFNHLLTQRAAVYERQITQFFADLVFRLEVARASKRHLDRYLANDFNVFRYISPDENRLSDIIADLLKPDGLHGQRALFLREFLRRVSVDLDRYDPNPNRYDLSKFRTVVREDVTHYNEWWESYQGMADGYDNWDSAETLIRLNRKDEAVAYFVDHLDRITTIARPIIDAALTETGTGLAIPPMGEP